ncbi:hypothetical protein PV326_011316 [Microctonus aethiopoides]|nr:hypothetical protein PV326_011316 [Microctonus aethiopoides]
MESECLEPLNLVIKKDNSNSNDSVLIDDDNSIINKNEVEEDRVELNVPDNMAILNESNKASDNGLQMTDQKILNALHMSNLMQMSNLNSPRGVSPPPYGTQYYFMQLLAMVEAQQLMCQQMSWPLPQQFIRNPLRLPQPYFDGPTVNLNEQLCNSPNSTSIYSMPNIKHEPNNSHEIKQSHSKRSTMDQKNSSSLASDNTKTQDTGQQNNQDKKKPHIKKPLNAFMLYMKEMRAKVVAECTLKESAAINQILGRRSRFCVAMKK